MRPLDRDLRAVFAGALVCAAVVASVRVTAVRAVFAVPLCLVLPGYALTAASFPGAVLGGMRALMLTLALSLATLALGALLLDAVPGGLRLGSWIVLLAVVVVGAGLVAWLRRARVTAGPSGPPGRVLRVRLRPLDVALVVLAAVVASAAMILSRTPLKAPNAIGYTQLWMLPTGSSQLPAVRIGVQSDEQHAKTYTLLLTTGSGRPLVIDRSLTLAPGAGRELNISLKPAKLRVRTLVTAELYLNGDATPYREVTALITPPSASR